MHVEIAHASNRSKFRCSRLLQKFSILLLKAQRPSVLNSQLSILNSLLIGWNDEASGDAVALFDED